MTVADEQILDKKTRILRAAVDVFARNGYFNARVTDVAKEAGVADGTIYLYFSGKEDLLVSIFREKARGYLASLKDVLSVTSDPAEQIRLTMRHHLAKLGEHRATAVVFQVELRQSLKFMGVVSREEVTEYLQLLRTIVESGQTDGTFRANLQPQLIANAIFGVLDEAVTTWILSDREYLPSDHAAELTSFVLAGLGRPS